MITDDLKQLWKIVFGDTDEVIDGFFAVAYAPERCKYILEDGKPVSALYWLDCEYEGGKLAYIYAVATHPDHRGKGLASRLLAETHNQLKELGYAGAVLKPAKGLFPFYKRLGYRTSGYIRRFTAEAGTPIPLEEVTVSEFSALRKALLPQDAVIQESVTLSYLHSFARFYAWETGCASVLREEKVILEYLGDPNFAPGVLAALGIKSQELTTPGQEIPYIMHYPLNCTKTPGYLGITLE